MCANPCPPGSYHKDCKRRCDCYNGAVCDHVNGKCHCLPGYQGTKVKNRLLVGIVADPDLPDPDPLFISMDADPYIIMKK